MATKGRKKPKTALGKWANQHFGRLFCKRSIIIISERDTRHVPVSGLKQLLGTVAVVGFVGWASYSSGSYMAAQKVLIEKERKLASTTEENARVEAEFALLKNDLMKLAESAKAGNKNAEYAKVIADQYNQPSGPLAGSHQEDKYSAVFQRISFLENKVKELQSNHDSMMADIRATTGGKIKELDQILARTGMDTTALIRAAEAKRAQDEQHKEKYGRTTGASAAAPAAAPPKNATASNGAADADDVTSSAASRAGEGGQGGPYQPLTSSVLKEKETELYFNLRHLMSLNDVVSAMPLAAPEKSGSFHTSSGFGTRVDPIRGRLAFHSGIDIVGPEHAKIIATNDGRVEFAGWKTAYGNVVDVKHDLGFSTRYAHLERVLVQPDQWVKKGQVIGVQGSTGRSTGHHLHYEVRYQGKALNPGNFLKAGYDVRALN